MNIIINDNIDYSENNLIYQEIKCGLGNQLFILFNLISLSLKYNYKFMLHFNKKYKERQNFINYSFFKNIQDSMPLEKNNEIYFSKYKNIENNITFQEINLKNKNFILKGYYQSYKYFWNYIEDIKKIIFIDEKLIYDIKKIYSSFNKPILSIHIRLGDYLKHADKFPIPSIQYFEKALSFYNLEDYQLILFSDNYDLAYEILKQINLNFIKASDYYNTDEEQFYMLMLSNVRICSNSTFSLMSCYFNEMYNFIENTEYIFPSKWFNKKFMNYNIDDLMINNKFIVIDTNNISYKKLYDVVTPIHEKDLNNYKKYLSTNKKYLNHSSTFYYISDKDHNIPESVFIDENLYPFTKNSINEYLKKYIPKDRIGWYYQQLLKLNIFNINQNFKENILILDADIIFLKPFFIIKKDIPNLYYIEFDKNDSKKIHKSYIHTLKYLIPDMNINEKNSGVCHHILFKKSILTSLLNKIEKNFNKPTWMSICDSVISYYNDNGYNISIFSEYELYFHYVRHYYKEHYEIKNNLLFLDTNINKFKWIDKKDYKFIGNHSWIK